MTGSSVISEDAVPLTCEAERVSCAMYIFNSQCFPLVGLLGLDLMVSRETSVIGKKALGSAAWRDSAIEMMT